MPTKKSPPRTLSQPQQPRRKPLPKATSTTTGIPIHCRYDKLIAAEQLTANPQNYRRHPDSHIAKIAGVIRTNGWRKPVVVSKLSGLIVTGHGATLAGVSMKDSVPVEYQDFATAAEEKRALIADNKASDGAKDDDSMLASLLKELEGVTPESLAMSTEEMERLADIAKGITAPPTGKGQRNAPKATISYNIIFDTVEQQARFYDALNKVKKAKPDLATVATRLDYMISQLPA